MMAAQLTPDEQAESPLGQITELLRQHFDTNAIVPVKDPWTRILDGMVVSVHIGKWAGGISLTAADFGLDADDYRSLSRQVTWGKFYLLGEELRLKFESIETQFRELPKTWGRKSHWGEYVPMSAMVGLRDKFRELEAEWEALIDAWIANYDSHYNDARDRAATFAGRAFATANRLGTIDKMDDWRLRQYDYFVDRMVARMMRTYPSPSEIRQRYTVELEAAFIPSPSMEAEQAAFVAQIEQQRAIRLEMQRREAERREYEDELERLRVLGQLSVEQAKQAEKLKLIEEHNAELRARLAEKADSVVKSFYRDYALHVRQLFHESLTYALESTRAGRLTPHASRSLRLMMENVKAQLMDGDVELDEMLTELNTLVGSRENIPPVVLQQKVEDIALLLQTGIVALGEAPRQPKRMEESPPLDILRDFPQPEQLKLEVRNARERLRLSASLAEEAIESGAFEAGDEIRRRRAAMLE